MAQTKTYLLRDIPAPLWLKVKVRAARDGKSVRDALLLLLKHYAESTIRKRSKPRLIPRAEAAPLAADNLEVGER